LLLKFIKLQNSDTALELTYTLPFRIFQIKMYLNIPSEVGCDAGLPGPLDPEDEGTAVLRNIGDCFPSDTSHTSRLESSSHTTVCIPNVEIDLPVAGNSTLYEAFED
jgi:hypothetical protein